MEGFDPNYQNKIGVLLTNLGTPDNPTKKSLRKYLKEFLSDVRVVDYNRVLWFLILHGIILKACGTCAGSKTRIPGSASRGGLLISL